MHRTVEMLTSARRILFVCHQSPDADTLGSALALSRALAALGKSVEVACDDPPPPIFNEFPEVGAILGPEGVSGQHDLAVMVDFGEPRRGGRLAAQLEGVSTLLIDHHANGIHQADHILLDTSVGATAEMIIQVMDALGVSMDAVSADWLYAGLLTDTGSFNFSNTTPQTLRMAARAAEAGAHVEEVSRRVFRTRSLARVRLVAACLSTLQMEGDFAWVHTDPDMYRRTGASETDAEGIINMVLEIEEVSVAAIFKARGDEVRVSLRSKYDVDVGEIAGNLGGGGHVKASGCALNCGLDEAVKRVKEAVAAARREPS